MPGSGFVAKFTIYSLDKNRILCSFYGRPMGPSSGLNELLLLSFCAGCLLIEHSRGTVLRPELVFGESPLSTDNSAPIAEKRNLAAAMMKDFVYSPALASGAVPMIGQHAS